LNSTLIHSLRLSSCRKEQAQFDRQMRSLWNRHRSELMLEGTAPGRRPYGFYKYDLGITSPCHWWQELQILIDRDLLTGEEAFAVETVRDVLSPNQSRNSGFEDKDTIARMGLSEPVLRHVQAEFGAASCWHRSRGRAELATQYQLRGDTINSYLSEVPCESRTDRDR